MKQAKTKSVLTKIERKSVNSNLIIAVQIGSDIINIPLKILKEFLIYKVLNVPRKVVKNFAIVFPSTANWSHRNDCLCFG